LWLFACYIEHLVQTLKFYIDIVSLSLAGRKHIPMADSKSHNDWADAYIFAQDEAFKVWT
jgi:hypothetical protein